MQRRTLNGFLISLLAAASWAGTSPGISYLLRAGVPNLSIALWRDVVVALGIFALFAVVQAKALRVDAKTLRGLAIAGVVSMLSDGVWCAGNFGADAGGCAARYSERG
jgi:drug/metabolite transporter (DMT)-like permease